MTRRLHPAALRTGLIGAATAALLACGEPGPAFIDGRQPETGTDDIATGDLLVDDVDAGDVAPSDEADAETPDADAAAQSDDSGEVGADDADADDADAQADGSADDVDAADPEDAGEDATPDDTRDDAGDDAADAPDGDAGDEVATDAPEDDAGDDSTDASEGDGGDDAAADAAEGDLGDDTEADAPGRDAVDDATEDGPEGDAADDTAADTPEGDAGDDTAADVADGDAGSDTDAPGPCDAPDACAPTLPPTCASATEVLFETLSGCSGAGDEAICAYDEELLTCPSRHVCFGGRCVADFVEVGLCRLQWPSMLEVPPSTGFDVTGRYFIGGVSDRTAGSDASDHVRVEFGVGGVDTVPAAWAWTAGSPTPGWNADVAGDAGLDEATAVLVAPSAEGDFGFAMRVSGDRGATWTYCDLQRGPGRDGSEDGFDALDAGALRVAEPVDVCDPNPCIAPAVRSCDGDMVVETETLGACTPDGDAVTCDYGFVPVQDCADTGLICVGARCESTLPQPMAGEVIVTEVMPVRSAGGAGGLWFEVASLSDGAVDLSGCTIETAGASVEIASPWIIGAGQLAVVATSTAIDATGGIVPDFVFSSFAGGPSGYLSIACGGTIVDIVAWESVDVDADVALQLSQLSFDGDSNDWPINWCDATVVYDAGVRGTPGTPNDRCPDVRRDIDWCTLQWPLGGSYTAGDAVSFYGRVHIPGLTTRTSGVDADRWVRAQVGYGRGAPSSSWTWVDAGPNPFWDSATAGAPNDDEYYARVTAPAASGSPYATRFRFSGDGGATWTLCNETGAMATVAPPDPCAPNPCLAPPAGSCDGLIARRVEAPGACTLPGPSCAFAFVETDCATAGGLCVGGYCPGAPPVDIGWCRLQYPTDAQLEVGESVTVYGRVWVSGLTDRSIGNDRYAALRGQVGYGPASIDPRVQPLGFTWVDASPNAAWNGVFAGEANNDEYEAILAPTVPGEYRFVYRFSGDGGATWLVCDGGPGGTADGYQPSLVGMLTVE